MKIVARKPGNQEFPKRAVKEGKTSSSLHSMVKTGVDLVMVKEAVRGSREEKVGNLPDIGSWAAEGVSSGWEAVKEKASDVYGRVREVVRDAVGGGEEQTRKSEPTTPRNESRKSEKNGSSDEIRRAERPKGPTLQGLPERPEGAKGGKEFIDSIKHLKPGPERDKAVLKEIMSGNIPESARNLKEVTVRRKGKDGKEREIKMHVMPDYLSIGSDKDNVRIPMTPMVAQAIADKTGTSLPTDRMVDDIHARSKKLHMAPFQWKPGKQHADNMKSLEYYAKHDQRVDDQLGTGEAQTELVSGHKKDLVIPAKDGRVAIYGGSWPGSGKRIQPYSNKHFDIYADYSHGVRLVSQEVVIDGKKMKLEEVLADPNLAPLVTRFPATGQPGALNNRYKVPQHLR